MSPTAAHAISPRKAVFSVAHRGASAHFPENTLPAFQEALRLGAKAIEFDLRLSADGFPIVMHDQILDRTTSGHGPVASRRWEELRQLDAGAWKDPRFTGTTIPSLEAALEVIAPQARPVIELKVPIPPALLLAALRPGNLHTQALVISFNPNWLAALRRESRDLPLGLLSDNWSHELPRQARALDAGTLLLHTDALGTDQVGAAQAEGLDVWCYTANDVGLVAACAAMGVTGIITDYPDLIRPR